jgi:DNA-binding transcriptional ArsR family regulator
MDFQFGNIGLFDVYIKPKSLPNRKLCSIFCSEVNIIYFTLHYTMQAITIRSIKAKSHPQTKGLFWYLFVGTRGGQNRVRIISQLRNKPSNTHQLSKDLGLDYKGIQHHLNTLEKNNLVTKLGAKYGVTYFVSPLFEEGELLFDEIVEKLKKVGGDEWLR